MDTFLNNKECYDGPAIIAFIFRIWKNYENPAILSVKFCYCLLLALKLC